MKHIPNILSALRFLGAICLLFCSPAGVAFWVIYGLCGISDMLDGFLARKLHAESKAGAVLDSVADICFVACCAIKLIPVQQIPAWLWIWAGVIVLIKLINQISALVVCKRFCFPHTGANRLTGLLLFLSVPMTFWSIIPIAFVAVVATFAAIQEGHLIRTRKREYSFITLRDRPELKKTASAWFHSKWSAPEEAYLECMDQYLSHQTELGWYLCLDDDRIIGGLGVIENDFHDRKDLTPNICAVYTEEAYRGQGIAGRLLNQAVEDLWAKGISPVYLLTDHTGFYERYGWEFLCMAQGDGESYLSRMYVHY
ncbi:MAG: GNAT family N-acetyltransferase [Bacteroidales bacterium]|nr:GNAT family N-acetyltransferase [Bacteroidales bacterium]